MKKLKTFCTALLMVVLTITTVNSQNNFHNRHILDPYNPEYVKGEVLIKFKDEVVVEAKAEAKAEGEIVVTTGVKSIDNFLKDYKAVEIEKVFKETRESLLKKSGGQLRYMTDFKGQRHEVPKLYNIYKLKFDETQDAKQLSELLSRDPSVDYAEPNYLFYTMDTYPDDPLYQDGSQWYLDAIDAPAAWDTVTGDTTQIIGIIDTGVDWDHPDLDDNIWTNWDEIPGNGIDDDANGYVDDIRGWDFVNDDNDPNDDNSHGTHVAGIAAAEGNNGIGMCGVSWNARIMPVKMLQSSGTGSSSDLASAIEYASDNGSTVINMSLGSYGESMTVKITLENAYAFAVLVAAAGNNGYKVDPPYPPWPPYAPMYPACYSFVIGVEAFTQAGGLAGFSNFDPSGPIVAANSYGHNYEMKAPGVGIYSTFPNGNYNSLSGTSMASPIVAGAVSLMMDYNPAQSTEQLFARLIQGADNGILDIFNSLDYELVPDLHFVEFTIVDTLPGCDNDGIADAGETIEIYLTVKNGGGWADSVWSKLRFGAFEDTTVANIIDSTSYIGYISAYATLTSKLDLFTVEIGPDVANNRDIVFEYEIGSENSSSFNGELIITVQNGEEYSGIYYNTVHLKPDKYYIITDNVVFDSLIIDPGTTIRFNPDVSILIDNYLSCSGTPDSMITFTRNQNLNWDGIRIINNPPIMEYCIIEYANVNGVMDKLVEGALAIENSIFRYCIGGNVLFAYPCQISNCIFLYNHATFNLIYYSNEIFENNLVVQNSSNLYGAINNYAINNHLSRNNCMFDNSPNDFRFVGGWNIFKLAPNYFGTSDSVYIEQSIIDYFEDATLPVVTGVDSALTVPPSECHGVVWKVEINDVLVNKYDNPYNSPTGLGVVGAETLKFDVYFNRPMDTTYTPFLTFGVCEPYTQQIVADSASWSADSTIWTAYKSIDATTGDGIQRVRAASARDVERFEIPIENSRFEFVIQAAGAASIDFLATAGIGKVDLEWPPAPSSDALGYNIYRSYNLTDSTYSDTLMINTELVLDTVYTDYNVIPDTTYHYFYKTLGTDMVETDYSKKATAIPFNAANGDANGDLSVNVLDITTIVSYMLNQNPSPFLFDAADVNYDGDINVLDIIGLVQLISGDKSVPLTALVDISEKTAYYDIAENILSLESEGNVAALQFNLGLKGKDFLPQLGEMSEGQRGQVQSLEKIRLFSLQQGFEFAYAVVDDHIIGILFSLTGKEIPEGDKELFRFEGINAENIEIINIFGGDLNGDYVPVLKKGQQSGIKLTEGYELTVQPNPFTNSTVISWQLAEEAMVDISIYNLKGEKIKQIRNSYQSTGIYQQTWNATDNNGKKLPAGIYICHMEAKTENRKITKDVKIILMR